MSVWLGDFTCQYQSISADFSREVSSFVFIEEYHGIFHPQHIKFVSHVGYRNLPLQKKMCIKCIFIKSHTLQLIYNEANGKSLATGHRQSLTSVNVVTLCTFARLETSFRVKFIMVITAKSSFQGQTSNRSLSWNKPPSMISKYVSHHDCNRAFPLNPFIEIYTKSRISLVYKN